MTMLNWWMMLPLHLGARVASFLLAPFVVAFYSSTDKRNLSPAFRWMGTIDNDLSGDDGWRNEHITGDPLSWWNRTKWLWRNGANYFNYVTIGVAEGEAAPESHRFYKIPCVAYNLEVWRGWAITGPHYGFCKYVFTIRIRSIKAG